MPNAAPRVATLFALTLCLPAAQAAFVAPDSVSASSFFDASYAPENTINGSGLAAGFTVDSPHDAYSGTGDGNHWTTANGTQPLDAFIVWTFATAQTLGGIHIWNHQSTQPPASNSGYDVTLFDLTFYDGADGAGAELLVLEDVSLAPNTATGQSLDLGQLVGDVRSVRFDVEGVEFSPNYTGLAEVRFDDARVGVPAPAPGLLVMAGLGFLVRRRWCRRVA